MLLPTNATADEGVFVALDGPTYQPELQTEVYKRFPSWSPQRHRPEGRMSGGGPAFPTDAPMVFVRTATENGKDALEEFV